MDLFALKTGLRLWLMQSCPFRVVGAIIALTVPRDATFSKWSEEAEDENTGGGPERGRD